MGKGDVPKTPKRRMHPYVESPVEGKEAPVSPEYRGNVSSKVVQRESLQRESKDRTNLFRLWSDGEGSEEGVLDAGGDTDR